MSNRFNTLTGALGLLLLSSLPQHALAADSPASREAAMQHMASALIGTRSQIAKDSTPDYPAAVPEAKGCFDYGGGGLIINGQLNHKFGAITLRCKGRYILALLRYGDLTVAEPRYEIIDTVLLPPITQGKFAYPLLYGKIHCESQEARLKDTGIFAFGHIGKRTRVTARYGVEQAWQANTERGKLEALAPQSVACERMKDMD